MAWVLRQRLELRQEDVAARSGVSPDTVSRLERGEIDGMTLATIRRIFAVFDAEIVLYVRWRGGDIDRLLDRRHAAMGEAMLERLSGLHWTVVPEVSFSEFGERGSIDLLGWHPATCTLLVIELKTELTSIEETIRRHDVKARLGAKVARERFGWEAQTVARLLVLPEERTARRQVERFEGLFRRSYPCAAGSCDAGWRRPQSGLGPMHQLFRSRMPHPRRVPAPRRVPDPRRTPHPRRMPHPRRVPPGSRARPVSYFCQTPMTRELSEGLVLVSAFGSPQTPSRGANLGRIRRKCRQLPVPSAPDKTSRPRGRPVSHTSHLI
jgi:transcriptional regulator with XRE-family HTH domain